MKNVQLSSANRVILTSNKETPQKQETEPKKKEIKDGDKKLKYAMLGLAVAGTVIAGGVIIHKALKGKNTDPINETDKIKNIITTYKDNLGKEVKVTFPNKDGVAKVGDELFSGSLTQIKNANGKKVETVVNYKNGKPETTLVNGVLKRGYSHFSNAKEIYTYHENGGIAQKAIHKYDKKSGKITRIYRETTPKANEKTISAIDYENGKIAAKTRFKSTSPSVIENCEIYDDKGNVIKTIRSNEKQPLELLDITEGSETKTYYLKSQGSFEYVSAKDIEKERVALDDIRQIEIKNNDGATTQLLTRFPSNTGTDYSMAIPDEKGIVHHDSEVINMHLYKNGAQEQIGFYNQNTDNEIFVRRKNINKTIDSDTKQDFISQAKSIVSALDEKGISLEIPKEKIFDIISQA